MRRDVKRIIVCLCDLTLTEVVSEDLSCLEGKVEIWLSENFLPTVKLWLYLTR